MKKTRLVSLIVSLILIFSLVGCTKNTENTNNGDNKDVSDIMGSKPHKESEQIESNEPNINDEQTGNLDDIIGDEAVEPTDSSDEQLDSSSALRSICEFRVIDCGQADSILIKSSDDVILIDAGESKDATEIKKVLDNMGVKEISLLVATHPHSDHIGGMQEIVENYNIKKIIMSPQTHTSKTYENLLNAIDAKGNTISVAEPGKEYSIGDINIKVIGPCDDYNELNDDSVVMVASYGNIDMLLTGDAEFTAEKDYVEYLDDSIELLKVGHHGSDTSTSDNLLSIIEPEVALISCGTDNKYGHPCQETLDKFNKLNIPVYRTDLMGDIIIRTDGNKYTIENKNGDELGNNNESNDIKDSNSDNQNTNSDNNNNSLDNSSDNNSQGNKENVVYISSNGTKYHSRETCSGLIVAREINTVSEQEAINNGLEKCKRCW